MITAVDTNIVLDVFLRDEVHGPQSREWLRVAYREGPIASVTLSTQSWRLP